MLKRNVNVKLKSEVIPVTGSEGNRIKDCGEVVTATFWFVAQCLNQLWYRVLKHNETSLSFQDSSYTLL
jgi:hypothetical protein